MLTKKQWLIELWLLLVIEGKLTYWAAYSLVSDSVKYWEVELSPGEVADRYLHFVEGLDGMREWYNSTPPDDYLNPDPRPQFV